MGSDNSVQDKILILIGSDDSTFVGIKLRSILYIDLP